MSASLTEEQRKRIEENRQRALAIRRQKVAESAQRATPFTAIKPQASNRPVFTNCAKPSTSLANVVSKRKLPSSFYEPEPAASNNTWGAKKKASKPAFGAFNTDKGQSGVISCALTSRTRFGVTSSYQKELVELFKSFSSKAYDPTTKRWSFSLQDYQNFIRKCELVAKENNLELEKLPKFIMSAFFDADGRPRPPKTIREVDFNEKVDDELLDFLFPYQKQGVFFFINSGGRCLIADDCGLGKTVQAIAATTYYRDEWPLLVVCPASVRFAWKEQVERHAAFLDPEQVVVLTSKKDDIPVSGKDFVLIISYDLVTAMEELMLSMHFKVVVLDESHYIKNHKTKRFNSILGLAKKAKRLLLLSGTPALSRPQELFCQIQCIAPFMFSGFHEFGVRYCAGKENPFGWDYSGASNMEELRLLLEETIMIRRMKVDVLKELPGK